MFWIWMLVAVAAIVGLSVLGGKALSRPRGGERVSRAEQQRITALKASGALRHRKSNRD